MWLRFSEISTFSSFFELKRLGGSGWGWFTALAVVSFLYGPSASMVAMTVMEAFSWCSKGF